MLGDVNEYSDFQLLDGSGMKAHTASNFKAELAQWGKIDRGTLKIKAEYANKSLVDLLADNDLAFNVRLVNTSYRSPVTGAEIVSAAWSVIREDNDSEVGHGMSSEYTPVAYQDALEYVFGDLKSLGAIPARVTNIGGGRRMAVQFILPDEFYSGGREHGLFYNVFASHDGSKGITGNSGDVCYICGNTYAMALAQKELRMYSRHTANVGNRLTKMAEVIFNIRKEAKTYYQMLDKAATIQCDSEAVKAFLAVCIPEKANIIATSDAGTVEVKRDNKAKENRRGELSNAINVTLAESNKSNATAYDLFEAATRYTSYRQQKRNSDEQFFYVLEGNGAEVNNRAMAWLKETVAKA